MKFFQETPALRLIVGLGSNLGHSGELVQAGWARAIDVLALQRPQLSDLIVSSPAESAHGDDFINAVGLGWTHLQPIEILRHLQSIEREFGRDRAAEGFHGARTLDLDLIDLGALVVQSPALTLPHPRMHLREFVLQPLQQIAPDFVHPRSGFTLTAMISLLSCNANVAQHSDI